MAGSPGWRPSRDECIALVEAYGKAWAAQDPAAICALFTEDATYNERPFVSDQAVFVGRKEIEKYWKRQIVGKQANIRFKQHIEDLMVDEEKSCCLVKWEARFDSLARGEPRPVHFIQVAILHLLPPVPGAPSCLPQIKSLEEYWHSKGQDSWTKGGELEKKGDKKKDDARDPRICWNFAHSSCKRGADCPYTHDVVLDTLLPASKRQRGNRPGLDATSRSGITPAAGAQTAPLQTKATPSQPPAPLPVGTLIAPTLIGIGKGRPSEPEAPLAPPQPPLPAVAVKGQRKGPVAQAVAEAKAPEAKPAQPKRGKGIRNDKPLPS